MNQENPPCDEAGPDQGKPESRLEARLERMTRLARRVLDAEIAGLSLVEHGRQWFTSVDGIGTNDRNVMARLCERTIQRQDVVLVRDVRLDSALGRFVPHDGTTVVFFAACPVRNLDGQAMGALCVAGPNPRDLSDREIQLLWDMAALIESDLQASVRGSVQVELVLQLEEERRRSMIDPLTRVWNREGIFMVLEAYLRKAADRGEATAAIMVDLDSFKQINDQWGHQAGDEVLRETARRMLESLRPMDVVGRYGGEEFLIVLGGNVSREAAVTVAERLRRRVCEGEVPFDGGTVVPSVSAGVAWGPPGVDAADLIRQADIALYEAKRSGRNRVCFHDQSSTRSAA